MIRPGATTHAFDQNQRYVPLNFTRAYSPTRLLVAESGDARLGFVLIEELRDYFTLERHGHVGILAVTEGAEGRGAGRALLRAAESWARDRGFQTLTLNVFSGNDHARAVYEHLGFQEETVKYVKRI